MRRIKDFWYKLSIKNKQLLVYFSLTFIICTLSFYSVYNIYTIVDDFNKDISDYYRINRLYEHFSENKNFLELYLETTREKERKNYTQNMSLINETLEKVDEKSNNSVETYFLINAIRNAKQVYDQKCRIAINEKYLDSGEHYKYFEEAEEIGEYIKGYIQQLLSIEIKQGGSYYNYLINRAGKIRVITFSGIVIMFFLCIIFIVKFSNYITDSIGKLTSASIQMSKGNLNVNEIIINNRDEVGVLAKSFNQMNNDMKNLVEGLELKSNLEKRLYEEEMKTIKMQQLLKEAQFLALQSQINPHFLFNTLNSIARTSMLGERELTTKLIRSLSNIFRYNLRQYNSTVNLDMELNTIKEYVFIQKHRFSERLSFELICEVDAEKIKIPCLSLQPLVENSIIHGIEPLESGGKIRVKIIEENQHIFIKIIDNGAGISKEKLEEIRKASLIEGKGDSKGIGLSNVISRLRLYFNNDCIKIWSKLGIGTIVIIKFRKNREDEISV